jgi:2-phosphosulfolactate phosphatase
VPTVRVLFTKDSLQPERLDGQVVVVLDISFATSMIVHAFAEGGHTFGRRLKGMRLSRWPPTARCACVPGEHLAEPIPGFAPATPLLLAEERLRGAPLVYCTTNGTVALRRAAGAPFVNAGALLNGVYLVEHIVRAHPGMPVLLLCCGSAGHFNLEDFYGADTSRPTSRNTRNTN